MRYTTALFSFDYILGDSTEAQLYCIIYALETMGFHVPPRRAILRAAGLTMPEMFTKLTGQDDPAQYLAFNNLCMRGAAEAIERHTLVFPQTGGILRSLHERGVRMGLVTIRYRSRLLPVLERCGVAQYLDRVIGREDVDIPRPNPEGILRALALMGVPKRQAVFVTSNPLDAFAARQAGVDFICITSGMYGEESFDDLPYHRLLTDLSQLSDCWEEL